MNKIKKNDLKLGFQSESIVKGLLEKHFNITLISTKSYCVVDYTNEEFEIELKTRNNKYASYPTTMIGQNKINHMKKSLTKGKRCILSFKFTDGLYILELNEDNIKLLGENQYGGRDDRNKDEYKINGYCFIPITLLTKI
tara:strand:- start:2535 stop:2954 length:420 start_codon:yes stop_codon:yes gene_type:complete